MSLVQTLPPPPRDVVSDASPSLPAAGLQSGVLAFRRDIGGELQVLLVSKRRSNHWGIPKGKAEPYLSLGENAAKEAYEEAGVRGILSPGSVGVFRTTKRSARQPGYQVIEVWVYLLEVTKCLSRWPEKQKRQTKWVRWDLAAEALGEPVLSDLCRQLAAG